MRSIELNSPAKVNLSLAITGRRDDGFHELISLVAPLEFGDTVVVTSLGVKGGVTLECDAAGIPTDSSNLAVKAADSFRQTFGLEEAIKIRIEKRIPSGAGLGGGSGNAAATLEGLQAIFELGDREILEKLAGEIGSDCPLFLRRRPLIMRGRGEILEELPESVLTNLVGRELFLFKPSFSISTKWAYERLAATPDLYDRRLESETQLSRWRDGKVELESILSNTLEKVTDRKFPSLPIMRESIQKEFGLNCLMSGSGSCSFALGMGANEEILEGRIKEDWGKHCFFQKTRISG